MTEAAINEIQRMLVRNWSVKVMWLRAAHEARMCGRVIHYIHATDKSPLPRQRELL